MIKRFLIIAFMLLCFLSLFSRIHISSGAQAFLSDNAEININGSWENNGLFSSGNAAIHFFGTPGTLNSSSSEYFYNVIIDTDLTLDSEVHITGFLNLNNGILDSIARSRNTNQARKKTIISRTGSLFLGDDVTITRNAGSLAFYPNVESQLNVEYTAAVTTGYEIPETSTVLQNMIVNVPSETVTLGSNITINDTLRIIAGNIITGEQSLFIAATALIDAFPSDITGNLIGESIPVGTSSYTNIDQGFQVSAGNDIGNIRSLVFLKPVTLGTDEGISASWKLDSDNAPSGRDLTLYWPYYYDNGVNNGNIQAWKSINNGNNWYQVREPTSTTSQPRSILIDNIQSFSDWTIAEPRFHFDVSEMDFEIIGVGNSAMLQFTVFNDRPEAISGNIITPTGFTVAEVSRNYKEALGDLSLNPDNKSTSFRNTIAFWIPASSSIDYNVTFSPSNNTIYSGYIQVAETVTGNPGRLLSVSGTGINLPNIEVTPSFFNDVLAEGENSIQNLNISNSGDFDLVYSASILYTTDVRDALVVNPERIDHYTGTCTSENKTDISETRVKGGSATTKENGWMKFNISPIPDNAVITSVLLRCYSTETNYPWWSITPVSNDPVTTDAATLNADILAEAEVGHYAYIQTDDPDLGLKDYPLTGTVNTDLQAALTQNWFAVGLASRDGSSTYFVDFDGWNELHPPYLEVQYTLSQSESWLTLDSGTSVTGIVENGTPDDIDIGFDTTGLADGNYSAVIILTSNDLTEPDINISVNLTVGEPIINVSVTELDFGIVELGFSETMQFYIENTGSLLLYGNITTPAGFEVDYVYRSDPSSKMQKSEKHISRNRNVLAYGIFPSDSQYFEITFTPTSQMDYNDNVIISHNTDGADELINVIGTGAVVDIYYDPVSFSEILPSDETSSDNLTIGNLGNATLNYTAFISYFVRDYNQIPKMSESEYINYDPDDHPLLVRQGGEDIATAFVINSLPFNDTGTTNGYIDDYDEVCPYSGSTSPDVVYVYSPMSDMVVDISLCNGSTYDTKLYVYENLETPGNPYACNDDACPGYVSELTGLSLVGGNNYYIVVDGYGGDSGDYVIDVTGVGGEYCTTGYSDTYYFHISNVELNTINNSSGSSGYEDFTAISTDLVKDDTYDIFVDISVEGSWEHHCKVWIDWNQDFDFDDANEEFDLGQTFGTGQLTTSITVPNDALSGSTRMRVSDRYDVDPESCLIGTYGEAEDYTIAVIELITDQWLSLDGEISVSDSIVFGGSDDIINVGYDSAGLPAGIYDANINITSNDPTEPMVLIPVQLTIDNQPGIYVSETALDFGNVEVGTSSVLQFYIENTGYTPLEGDITTPDGFSVSETVIVLASRNNEPNISQQKIPNRNTLPYSIDAGSNTFFDLTFSPIAQQTYIGDVEVSHNATGEDRQIAVSGTGVVADIDVNPLFFDKLLITETTTSDVLNISNLDIADLNYSAAIDFYGPETGWLTLNGITSINGTITYSETDSITVGFDATGLSENTYTADIEITSNDPDEGVVLVPVSLEVLQQLGIPQNVTIGAISNEEATDVTIQWDAVYGATSYTVYRTSDPFASFPSDWLSYPGIDSTSVNFTTARQKRFYRITANID